MTMTRRPIAPKALTLAQKCDAQALGGIFSLADLRSQEMYAYEEEMSEPRCAEPVMKFEGPDAIFQTLGFPHSPVSPKQKTSFYPMQALPGDHPLCFLQWGARVESSCKRIIFEMGDGGLLASLEFFGQGSQWHVDRFEFECRGSVLAVDCSAPDERGVIERAICSLREAIVLLNQDRIDEARDAFHAGLDPVFKQVQDNGLPYARDNARKPVFG